MFENSDAASIYSAYSTLNSPTSTIRSTSTIRTVDSGYSPSIISTRASRVSSNASLTSPLRSPIALFPDITLRGSLRSPRDESKRARAVSSASSTHSTHHRHRSPPRSPQETKHLYDHAMQRAVTDTASITEGIISRQSEILARKHDIAVWQRKIHAAEKLINTMQDQVDCLVKTAREKQMTEKELTAQRDAMMSVESLTEKEYTALGLCLGDMDLNSNA